MFAAEVHVARWLAGHPTVATTNPWDAGARGGNGEGDVGACVCGCMLCLVHHMCVWKGECMMCACMLVWPTIATIVHTGYRLPPCACVLLLQVPTAGESDPHAQAVPPPVYFVVSPWPRSNVHQLPPPCPFACLFPTVTCADGNSHILGWMPSSVADSCGARWPSFGHPLATPGVG